MPLEILIPDIDNKPRNTKDAVITALTMRWPQTLAGIYSELKRNFQYSSSYQAVYKAVTELMDAKVITRKENGYELNLSWIKSLQSFTDIVETNYYAKKRVGSPLGWSGSRSGKDIVVLSFSSVFDAEKYLYYYIKNRLFKLKGKELAFHLSSEWRPLFYLRAEYNFYRKLAELSHTVYHAYPKDAEIMFLDFYKSLGVRIVRTSSMFYDAVVLLDTIVQIYYPNELKMKLAKISPSQDVIPLIEGLGKEREIRVVVHKDKNLASQMLKGITDQG